MRTVSTRFANPRWQDWHGVTQTVPAALQSVAQSFAELQDERQTADYNNHEAWSAIDVEEIIVIASTAFADWQAVREEPIAGDYLLAMLIGKSR